MFWLIALATVVIPFGYIIDAMPIAIGMIILYALIGMPIIARMEAYK